MKSLEEGAKRLSGGSAPGGGPGTQRAQLRRGRRPPVPLGAQGGREAHLRPGRRLREHARRRHRQRRAPALPRPRDPLPAPTSGCRRSRRSTGSRPRCRRSRNTRSTPSTPGAAGARGHRRRLARGPEHQQARQGHRRACARPRPSGAPASNRLRRGEGHEPAPGQHRAPHRRPAHPGREGPPAQDDLRKDRLRLLERSLDALPRGVPVNVILYPMEGDPMASPAFWKVAMATRGSMMTPSSDWP